MIVRYLEGSEPLPPEPEEDPFPEPEGLSALDFENPAFADPDDPEPDYEFMAESRGMRRRWVGDFI